MEIKKVTSSNRKKRERYCKIANSMCVSYSENKIPVCWLCPLRGLKLQVTEGTIKPISLAASWQTGQVLLSQAWKLWLSAPKAKSGDEVTRYLISMATEGMSASHLLLLLLPFFWGTETSGCRFMLQLRLTSLPMMHGKIRSSSL